MKDKPVILVVDDEPQNIELLEAYLAPLGYEIVTAASGAEALEKLSGNKIDLILLDILMPGMDGFEVTRWVRQDNTHRLLPIILITVLWEKEDRVKGIEAGCDDFLSKPVDKMELLARVRSLLKVKAYNDLMSNYRKELESEVTSRTEELKHALENLQRDITERKQAEEALRDSEKRYRTLFQASADGILIADIETKAFKYANPALYRMLGYTEEELRTLGLADIHPKEDLQRVIAEFEAQTRGDKTLAVDIPCLRKDGRILYADINTTSIMIDGRPCNVGIFRDITEHKRAEEELQQTLESLRKAVGATIQVMVSAVEARDPYTAGHQLRSADLARAIATEMGLPQEKIDGIRVAGSIHDIGKLSIPAEILSKPTKLTNIEFSLIKEHSRKGYEMLKDVESQWPLAQIIYQHHERMNGSGYPRNLKRDDILMEARIMAVADVVEAMASHRPYRPALGIDGAMVEIENNKGTIYDNAVVDACLRLFREKGYQLKKA